MTKKRKDLKTGTAQATPPEKKIRVTRSSIRKSLISSSPESSLSPPGGSMDKKAAQSSSASDHTLSSLMTMAEVPSLSPGKSCEESFEPLASKPKFEVNELGEKSLSHGSMHPLLGNELKSKDVRKSSDLSKKHHHAVHGVLRKSLTEAAKNVLRKYFKRYLSMQPNSPAGVVKRSRLKSKKSNVFCRNDCKRDGLRKSFIPVAEKELENVDSIREKKSNANIVESGNSFPKLMVSPKTTFRAKKVGVKKSSKSADKNIIRKRKLKSCVPQVDGLNTSPQESISVLDRMQNNFFQVYKDFLGSHDTLMPPLKSVASEIAGDAGPSGEGAGGGNSQEISAVSISKVSIEREAQSPTDNILNKGMMETSLRRLTRKLLKDSDIELNHPVQDPESIGKVKKSTPLRSRKSMSAGIMDKKKATASVKTMLPLPNSASDEDGKSDALAAPIRIYKSGSGKISSNDGACHPGEEISPSETQLGSEKSSATGSIRKYKNKPKPKPKKTSSVRTMLPLPNSASDEDGKSDALVAPSRIYKSGSGKISSYVGDCHSREERKPSETPVRSEKSSMTGSIRKIKNTPKPKPKKPQQPRKQKQFSQGSRNKEPCKVLLSKTGESPAMTTNTMDKDAKSLAKKKHALVSKRVVKKRKTKLDVSSPEPGHPSLLLTSGSIAFPNTMQSPPKSTVSCQTFSPNPVIPINPPFIPPASSRRMVIIMDEDDECPQDRWVLIKNPNEQVHDLIRDVLQGRLTDDRDSHAPQKEENTSSSRETPPARSSTQEAQNLNTIHPEDSTEGVITSSLENQHLHHLTEAKRVDVSREEVTTHQCKSCGHVDGSTVIYPEGNKAPKSRFVPHSSHSQTIDSNEAVFLSTPHSHRAVPLPHPGRAVSPFHIDRAVFSSLHMDGEVSPLPIDRAISPLPIDRAVLPLPINRAISHLPIDRTISPLHIDGAVSPLHIDRAVSPLYIDRAVSPLYIDRAVSPLYIDRAVSPLYIDRAVSPLYIDRAVSPLHIHRAGSPPSPVTTKGGNPKSAEEHATEDNIGNLATREGVMITLEISNAICEKCGPNVSTTLPGDTGSFPSTDMTIIDCLHKHSTSSKPAPDQCGASCVVSPETSHVARMSKNLPTEDQTMSEAAMTENHHRELGKAGDSEKNLSEKNSVHNGPDRDVMGSYGVPLNVLNQSRLHTEDSTKPAEDVMSEPSVSTKEVTNNFESYGSATNSTAESDEKIAAVEAAETVSNDEAEYHNAVEDNSKLCDDYMGVVTLTNSHPIDEWGKVTDYVLYALQGNQLQTEGAELFLQAAASAHGELSIATVEVPMSVDSEIIVTEETRTNDTDGTGKLPEGGETTDLDTGRSSRESVNRKEEMSKKVTRSQAAVTAVEATPDFNKEDSIVSKDKKQHEIAKNPFHDATMSSQASSSSAGQATGVPLMPGRAQNPKKYMKSPSRWRELFNLQDCFFSPGITSLDQSQRMPHQQEDIGWNRTQTRSLRPNPVKTKCFQYTPGKTTAVEDGETSNKVGIKAIECTPVTNKSSKPLGRLVEENLKDTQSKKSRKEESGDVRGLELCPWKTGKKAANWELKKRQMEMETVQQTEAIQIHEEAHLGELVWAHLGSTRWWPAIVFHASQAGMKPASQNRSWVFWYGDHKVSQIPHSKMVPFAPNFNQHYSTTGNKAYMESVLEVLQECASRAARDITDPDDLIIWGCAGCLGLLDVDPNPSCPVPQFVLEYLHKIAEDNETSDSDSDSDDRNLLRIEKMKKKKVSCLTNVRSGAVKITEVCIVCDVPRKTIAAQHPLFKGGLCQRCLSDLMDTMFSIGADGLNVYCVICGNAGDLYVCDDPVCKRVYCTGCILELAGDKVLNYVASSDTWLCFLCTKPRPNTHGLLVPKNNWRQNILDLFTPVGMFQPQVPAAFDCQPIRVLSLFDGIGTGRLILSELGIEVDSYLASEVDADAIMVTRVRHQDVTHLGDITALDHSKLASLAPVDLLIGGSPCNEISVANPTRKGLEGGTGTLFFEFHRAMRVIQHCNKGRHLFWLFENVYPMPLDIKQTISRFLGCEPAKWDAKHFSAQKRSRYFWGNIPGMYSPPETSLIGTDTSKADLSNVLMPSRVATVKKVRTVTTKVNSLLQGKAQRTLPVQMGADGDTLWIPEMERMFGFPDHYTDVGNLPVSRRHKLLGKSWSIPVMKHLMRPLRRFFKTREGPQDGQIKRGRKDFR